MIQKRFIYLLWLLTCFSSTSSAGPGSVDVANQHLTNHGSEKQELRQHTTAQQHNVILIETDSADCVISDGKLISIQSTNREQSYEVWLDRWFMDVQTADHTRQILSPDANTLDLGCSSTRNREKQHWTIYSIKPL